MSIYQNKNKTRSKQNQNKIKTKTKNPKSLLLIAVSLCVLICFVLFFNDVFVVILLCFVLKMDALVLTHTVRKYMYYEKSLILLLKYM